ncbi:hypothetical protein CCACVL1_20267 [Corchorus capsularis]|uniref:ENT domain-containing protein n=1 Tax=Corchorus capsularis TaxID=210143 RepID=A0A1R3HBW7_COCAP|nr:hypothetical protein CCACVL1_20267 [Corchorus capsularis]
MFRTMDHSMQYPIEPHGTDIIDMSYQLRCLEIAAYGSVLRAFRAQADHLSWDQEGIITQLRQELNVSDAEHGELLLKINSDESIKLIREWQNGDTNVQESFSGDLNASESALYMMGYALQKKRKTSHSSDSIMHLQEPHVQASAGNLPIPIPAPPKHTGNGILKSKTERFDHSKGGPDVIEIHETKKADVIEIHETKKLLQEIEKVVNGRKGTDPAQIEKAKLILSVILAHERSLLWALAKLSDVADDDGSPVQMLHHYSNGEVIENMRPMPMNSNFQRQAGGSLSYAPKNHPPKKSSSRKSHRSTHSVKLRTRRV